jgi:hypothetical protein
VTHQGMSARIVGLVGLIACLCAVAQPASAGVLRLTRSAGRDENPVMNSRRQVVWSGHDGHDFEIFLWTGASVQQITDNEVDDQFPRLNNAGQITWQEDSRVYLWERGTARQLTTTADSYPAPHSYLNEAGQVVWEGRADGSDHIFLWDGASVRQLSQGRERHFAPSLNNRGQVVWLGPAPVGQGWHVYLWDGMTVRHLSRTSTDNWGAQISDAGHVVWHGKTNDGFEQHVFLWDGSSVRLLSDPAVNRLNEMPRMHPTGKVVWQALGASGWDLFLWDGSSVHRFGRPGTVSRGWQFDDAGRVVFFEPDDRDRHVYRWDGTRVEELTGSALEGYRIAFENSVVRGATGQVAWPSRGEIYLYTPPAPGTLELMPSPVVGGDSTVGRVTLPGPAPAGGLVVRLTSGNPGLAMVPASVTVPAGAVQATFPVSTQPVATDADVLLTASAGEEAWQVALRVWSVTVVAVQLDVDHITGGEMVTGTVKLAGVAGDSGAAVDVTTDNPAVATVMDPTVVPAGADQIRFRIQTTPVSAATSVVITAKLNGTVRTATLRVEPLALKTVWIFPSRVAGTTLRQIATGHVALEARARERDVVVTLESDQPEVIQLPASVTIPRGSDSASFPVRVAPVITSVRARISASSGGVVRTALLDVDAAQAVELSIKLDAVTGGVATAGWLIFGTEPPGDFPVTLRTDRPDLVQVPARVLTRAGQRYVEFPLTTRPVSEVTRVRVIGSFNGEARAAWLTLLPVGLVGFSVAPVSNGNGETLTGTVVLSGPAPTGGATVFLTTNQGGNAMSPLSVVVPAGATAFSFKIETLGDAQLPVTITAYYAGIRRSATLWPPTATGIRFQPQRVVGGRSSVGTITVFVPAPEGGQTLKLVSDNPSVASGPPAVTIPAGEYSVSFPVSTSAVTTDARVNFSASGFVGTLEVVPAGLVGIEIEPAKVTGGAGATGRVTLTEPAPAGGTRITLASGSPAVSVPSGVTVPPGESSASFPITTSPVAVSIGAVVAAVSGEITRTAGLTVLSPSLVAVQLDPPSVVGGLPVTGTVVLDSPAPTGGITVRLLTTDLSVSVVPDSVTVPAGATRATFPIATDPVPSRQRLLIVAQLGVQQQTAPLTLLPRPAAP